MDSYVRWLATEAPGQQAAAWSVLDPQTVKASFATLTDEADDRVVASGKFQPNETYTLTFKTHQKDHASRRGLLLLVGKRNSLLKYLASTDRESYHALIKRLCLRK